MTIDSTKQSEHVTYRGGSTNRRWFLNFVFGDRNDLRAMLRDLTDSGTPGRFLGVERDLVYGQDYSIEGGQRTDEMGVTAWDRGWITLTFDITVGTHVYGRFGNGIYAAEGPRDGKKARAVWATIIDGEPASLIAADGRLFVTTRDGKILWQKTLSDGLPREGGHSTASLASASPVTDGEHVFAFFGSQGLFCLDLDGEYRLPDNFFDVWPGIPTVMEWPRGLPAPRVLRVGEL